MLNLLDDYAIHQTPEPLSRPASSDRNFYDRWFFSGFAEDGSVMFEAALGLYPHRRVMDAHFTVLVDGVQRCFHGSRLAPQERTDTSVGPFHLDVEKPMRLQRLRLDDAASGLACDLRFSARSVPGEEPASRLFDGDRLLMHTTRFVQFGCWDGELRIDGKRLTVKSWRGVRDRSWGIRPCGEPDAGAPGILQRSPTVYWAWVPLNFDDRCTQFNTFEDPQGRATQLAAAVQPAYEDPALIPPGEDLGLREMQAPALRVRWKAGTRWPEGGSIVMQDAAGAEWRIEMEPLATLLTKGLGYHHAEWGHGLWKGELALGHERLCLADLDPLRPDHNHVHQLVRARLQAPDGERQGVGLLETMCFGPHAPSGFRAFLDGAADRSDT
jgi:hypothetical protein